VEASQDCAVLTPLLLPQLNCRLSKSKAHSSDELWLFIARWNASPSAHIAGWCPALDLFNSKHFLKLL
jgi:hypothetical protein